MIFAVEHRAGPDGRDWPTPRFLQMRRLPGAEPLAGTWQPVIGHIEPGERAIDAAWRELSEEAGLSRGDAALVGLWSLEGVHPYFLARADAIVMPPRFAVRVAPAWSPTLTPGPAQEHDAFRWVWPTDVGEAFLWPGQCHACIEIETLILPGGPAASALALHP